MSLQTACERQLDGAAPTSTVAVRCAATAPTRRTHILTVGLEDYFQVGAFGRLVDPRRWDQFEPRLEHGARATLELLDHFGARATFFVLGWTAERFPGLVHEIAERGHEIALRGDADRRVRDLSRAEFRERLVSGREILEEVAGRRVVGFRAGRGWLRPADLWALDVLADERFAYDSSLVPLLRRFAREPHRHVLHRHESAAGPIWEVPPSTRHLLGYGVPIGGNAFRQFPDGWLRRSIADWCRASDAPLVTYFHTWELDPGQPRITAAGPLARARHYRNLGSTARTLEHVLSTYRFDSIAGTLDMTLALSAPPRATVDGSRSHRRPVHIPREQRPTPVTPEPRLPVTLVIPCYNEERTVPHLVRTLLQAEAWLSERYDLRVILVDDGSQDGTWRALQTAFAGAPNVRLVAHRYNCGIAAAIRTGIGEAETEIVCSTDADGSYDVRELERMIPLLADGVDLVTASPYHRDGEVRNVPGWRLLLSKGSSLLYRVVLGRRLATFTSCCRVYRRNAVQRLDLRESGYLGIAELAGRLALEGGHIVEHPATLDVRLFGQSKMKVARTILGHLRLLARLAAERIRAALTPRMNASELTSSDASESCVPEGQLKIAQHFSAGTTTTAVELSPIGTTESDS